MTETNTLETNTLTELPDLCTFCGVENSFAALKQRWLSILSPELRTAALLQGAPDMWSDTLISHFREHCLSQVDGDTYEIFAENVKDLFHQLIFQTANELAGVFPLDVQIELNEQLAEMKMNG